MRRSVFLKRSLGLVAGVAVGSRLPLESTAAPVVEEVAAPVVARGALAAIVAVGGLCAPLTPYYELTPLTLHQERPVRDALPSFTAQRGLRYDVTHSPVRTSMLSRLRTKWAILSTSKWGP